MVLQHKNLNQVFDGRYLLLAGILCLAVSITWASIILAGLPNVVLQISAASSSIEDIYALQIQFPFPSPISINIPLWFPVYMQNITFSLGTFLAFIYLWSLYISNDKTNVWTNEDIGNTLCLCFVILPPFFLYFNFRPLYNFSISKGFVLFQSLRSIDIVMWNISSEIWKS